MGKLPEGKIVVLAPEKAALVAYIMPGYADRIFTLPGLDVDTVYVIDTDFLKEDLRQAIQPYLGE